MQNRITINPEVLMQACKEARQLTKLTGNKNKAAFTTRMGQRVMPRLDVRIESRNTATSENWAATSSSSTSASSMVKPWR